MPVTTISISRGSWLPLGRRFLATVSRLLSSITWYVLYVLVYPTCIFPSRVMCGSRFRMNILYLLNFGRAPRFALELVTIRHCRF